MDTLDVRYWIFFTQLCKEIIKFAGINTRYHFITALTVSLWEEVENKKEVMEITFGSETLCKMWAAMCSLCLGYLHMKLFLGHQEQNV